MSGPGRVEPGGPGAGPGAAEVRRARREDLEGVRALLDQAGLPPSPPGLALQNCLVALDGRGVVGVAAFELRGLRAHLFALAVASPWRGRGLGTSLLESILARTHELSLRDVFVLPGEEDAFFEKRGFVAADWSELPRDLRRAPTLAARAPDTPLRRFPLATRCL